MTDGVAITAGTGTTINTDDVGGVHTQRVKVTWGADGTVTDASAANPVPVVQTGALPAGSAAIGKLAANSGIDIGDVDITSIAAGDNNIGNVDIVTVPTDPFGANADAASATGSISAKLRFIASTGIPVTGTVTVGSHAVTVASGGIASGGVASGAIASGAFASGALASGSIASGAITAGAIAAGATSIAENEDVASADGDRGVKMLAVRKATPANTSGTDGDYEFFQMSAGRLWTSSTITDGSGNVIGATSNALDVNIKSGASSGTQYTEDVAAAADPVGTMLVAVRRDTLSTSEVSADGDNIALKATNKGQLHIHVDDNQIADNITDNAGFTDGTTKTLPIAFIFDEVAGTALTENDAGAARMDAKRSVINVLEDETTRGQRLAITAGKAARIVPRMFSAAATTVTRPANTTAYTAGDAIANNATAGSVTASSATLSAVNDDPILIRSVLLHTTDTGLQGKNVRAYLYNSDPTASSGVTGGDNAAFSNKKAGFIGSCAGLLKTFSDGASGVLIPEDGQELIALPTSGAKTIFIQYQAVDAFTPSANSTTLIGTINGIQGHA